MWQTSSVRCSVCDKESSDLYRCWICHDMCCKICITKRQTTSSDTSDAKNDIKVCCMKCKCVSHCGKVECREAADRLILPQPIMNVLPSITPTSITSKSIAATTPITPITNTQSSELVHQSSSSFVVVFETVSAVVRKDDFHFHYQSTFCRPCLRMLFYSNTCHHWQGSELQTCSVCSKKLCQLCIIYSRCGKLMCSTPRLLLCRSCFDPKDSKDSKDSKESNEKKMLVVWPQWSMAQLESTKIAAPEKLGFTHWNTHCDKCFGTPCNTCGKLTDAKYLCTCHICHSRFCAVSDKTEACGLSTKSISLYNQDKSTCRACIFKTTEMVWNDNDQKWSHPITPERRTSALGSNSDSRCVVCAPDRTLPSTTLQYQFNCGISSCRSTRHLNLCSEHILHFDAAKRWLSQNCPTCQQSYCMRADHFIHCSECFAAQCNACEIKTPILVECGWRIGQRALCGICIKSQKSSMSLVIPDFPNDLLVICEQYAGWPTTEVQKQSKQQTPSVQTTVKTSAVSEENASPFPGVGSNENFVMSYGEQTINGSKTFSNMMPTTKDDVVTMSTNSVHISTEQKVPPGSRCQHCTLGKCDANLPGANSDTPCTRNKL